MFDGLVKKMFLEELNREGEAEIKGQLEDGDKKEEEEV